MVREGQTFEVLNSYDWDSAIGIGAILGHNDFRALDIDGCGDSSFIDKLLDILRLPLNYEWVVRSGSHDGFHIYFASMDDDFSAVDGKLRAFLPAPDYRTCFRRIEFRWQDHLVLPPSLHSSTNRYEFKNIDIPVSPPAPVPIARFYQLLGRVAARASSKRSMSVVEFLDLQKLGFEGGANDWEAMREEDWRFDEMVASDESFASGTISEEFLDVEFPDALPDPSRADESEYVRPYYLFFDTETTGLPKGSRFGATVVDDWPRLVQIAWMKTDPRGRAMRVGNHIVKPRDFVIPFEATRVHGITNERAQAEGEELADVLLRFERAVLSSDTLVAHNMAFDAGVIGAEFLRNNLATMLFSKPKICTMEESTAFCGLDSPYGPKWPTLDQLYSKLFGARREESHDALVDVRATAKCFWELRKRGVL